MEISERERRERLCGGYREIRGVSGRSDFGLPKTDIEGDETLALELLGDAFVTFGGDDAGADFAIGSDSAEVEAGLQQALKLLRDAHDFVGGGDALL